MFELLKTPDYVSLSNVALGILSILVAACSDDTEPLLSISAALLLLAAVADGMDGWVARKTSGGGPLGEHIDSLADVISFGIAPAVLLTVFCKVSGSRAALFIASVVACIYVICGVLRLARYNAFHSEIPSGYEGIPITAGCVAIAVFTIFLDKIRLVLNESQVRYIPFILIAAMFVMSLLMISKVPYSKVMKTNTFLFLIAVFALTVLSSIFVSVYAAIAPGILSFLMIIYLIIPVAGKLSGRKRTEI